MTEDDLKNLFAAEEIPPPDENARKVAINLAVAEFEKNKKSENISQGNGFWSRLIGNNPLNSDEQRSEKMSFSKKKVIYSGLATACVALLVYNVATPTLSTSGITDAVMMSNLSGAEKEEKIGEISPSMQIAMQNTNQQGYERTLEAGTSIVPTQIDAPKRMADVAAVSKIAKSEAISPMVGRAVPEASYNNIVSVPSPASIAPMVAEMDVVAQRQQEFGRDKFEEFEESQIKDVRAEPISTFSIDVDTSSYSFARSSLDRGVLPQKDSIRIEEMINYFDYAYPLPEDKSQPFSTNVVMKPSPWGEGKQLMTIGIKGFDIPITSMPNSNLVFLLDVSGSMNEPTKLPLLKQSIALLLDTLKPTDTVAIVVYAGAAGTVLPPTRVENKNQILLALQNLSAGGGTAGAEGIRQAYQLAEMNFDKNSVNRVILGTDGDFNVGITNQEELKDFVEREKNKGIFLSVLGFGRGNYNDAMMQTLAQNGNGTAAYIDSLSEARKVLVEEATKTLFPIAKDVKIQVEFNPATVAEYRLVGYETRALKTEDFNNDKVDAGDIGAGAEVTAIYEITPVGGPTAVDPSRYAQPTLAENKVSSNELAFVKVRYKLPNEDASKLLTTPVTTTTGMDNPILNAETDWAVAVASFAQILKGGKYTGTMTYEDVLKLAQESKGVDPYGYRAEFITLVHKAKTAAGLEAQPTNGGYVGGSNGGVVIQPYPYPVPNQR
ncbi:MAG: VWA domain-containing protein [Pseudobdellovibrionaceae bacterium]|jgi:Ca-activated chloride channel family protein|nr:VWA domain-containing protein [Pseudobdellovibrionaceae bacterium]